VALRLRRWPRPLTSGAVISLDTAAALLFAAAWRRLFTHGAGADRAVLVLPRPGPPYPIARA
jgi:hypothetical protein